MSPFGGRAFVGFNYSNNLGMIETPWIYALNHVRAATIIASGTGAGIKEVAWTPYANKVLAAVWYTTLAGSQLMILESDSITTGFNGIIDSNYYWVIPGNSANHIQGPGCGPILIGTRTRSAIISRLLIIKEFCGWTARSITWIPRWQILFNRMDGPIIRSD